MKAHDKATLLIHGGHLFDPAARIDAPMDILLKDGRVAEVAVPRKIKGADHRFDARGLVVSPGFIDLHAHLQSFAVLRCKPIESAESGRQRGYLQILASPHTCQLHRAV